MTDVTHPYRAYTPAETAAIVARYPTEGAVALAREMGRSRQCVIAKAHRMGLRAPLIARVPVAGREWSPEEDGRIRAEWPDVATRRKGHSADRLAAAMGVTVNQLRGRAGFLGLRGSLVKTPPWTPEEDEMLMDYVHLSVDALRDRFKRAGFPRTNGALLSRRGRIAGCLWDGTAAYSANGLAQLMGCSHTQVNAWIKRGWLKATPRTASIDPRTGGPGDRWLIYPRDVRNLICLHTAHVNLHRADKFWLVDLLAGTDHGGPAPLRQDRCGVAHVAADGYAEYEVAA